MDDIKVGGFYTFTPHKAPEYQCEACGEMVWFPIYEELAGTRVKVLGAVEPGELIGHGYTTGNCGARTAVGPGFYEIEISHPEHGMGTVVVPYTWLKKLDAAPSNGLTHAPRA